MFADCQKPVHRHSTDASRSFKLSFDKGYSLPISDDSERYESFSIRPDAIDIGPAAALAVCV